MKTVAVAGGGISGLAVALALARSGRFKVTLFEKSNRLGGLSGSVSIAGTTADRFYHVILPGDQATLAFLDDLGLRDELEWRPSRAGFYGRGRLVPFASALDFLRFPFLSPWAKIRLGWGILRTARSASPSGPGEPTAPEWLRRRFGPTVTANFWDPLLRSKLGTAKDRTPASFMDATIKRLFGARSSAGGRERLGGVRGGYAPILAAAERSLRGAEGEIKLETSVRSVTPIPAGLEIGTSDGPRAFDRVFLALPLPEALKIVGAPSGDPAWERYRRVEHMGIVCLLVALRRSLSPYYLINLLDPELPFTGIVETTNVLGPEHFGGRHLIYLPKYFTPGDQTAAQSDVELTKLFLSHLKRVFPDFSQDDILETRVHREAVSLPLPLFGPSLRTAGFRSPIPGLFLGGTAFIGDATVNNDAALRAAAEAVKEIGES